jgi:broad specificity phosphatase PhoE
MRAPTTAYLFRHGEALNNVRVNTISGRSGNDPLTEKGMRQAELLGKILLEKQIIPDLSFSSSAVRARQTGEITLRAMGLPSTLVEDDRLHEQETGDWTGRIATEIFNDEVVATIETQGKDFRSPNGESMNDVSERVVNWLNDLDAIEGRSPKTIFAFTHGGPLRSLPSHLLGWSHAETYAMKPNNTSATVVVKNGNTWRVEAIGVNVTELKAK